MTCPSIARWPGTQASSVPWRITAGAPARVDAAIFARAIRLNEALRSHLLRDAVKDAALARVLGNGATAGTWGAAPAGVRTPVSLEVGESICWFHHRITPASKLPTWRQPGIGDSLDGRVRRNAQFGEHLHIAVAQPIEAWAPDPAEVGVVEGVTEDVGKSPSHSRSEPRSSVRFPMSGSHRRDIGSVIPPPIAHRGAGITAPR
jgi:hypothetical protein